MIVAFSHSATGLGAGWPSIRPVFSKVSRTDAVAKALALAGVALAANFDLTSPRKEIGQATRASLA